MTTGAAQRRLLEAIADLSQTPGLDIGDAGDPLEALAIGIGVAAEFAIAAQEPGVARIWTRLATLVLAVRDDLNDNRKASA